MPMFDDDPEFDTLLRTALADRPEPRSEVDFAGRAMAMAPTPHVSVWPTVAAVLAIAAVVVWGALRLASLSSSSTTTITQVTSSSEVVALLPAGGIGLLVALAWLTMRTAFERDDAVRI